MGDRIRRVWVSPSYTDHPLSFVDLGNDRRATVDRPYAVIGLLEADGMLLQGIGDGRWLVLETCMGHLLHREMAGICDGWQPLWIRAQRMSIAGSGCPPLPSVMGTFVVAGTTETISCTLPGTEGVSRWTAGAGLERAMHAFVGSFLQEAAWAYPLVPDIRSDQPDVEPGKMAYRLRALSA
jgi:hypothetical protein